MTKQTQDGADRPAFFAKAQVRENKRQKKMTYNKPRIPLTLPPLDAYAALDIIEALESIIKALWRVHGDQMADIRAREGIDTPAPEGSTHSINPGSHNDTSDIDF